MQFLKVWLFRWYYRWANKRAWRHTVFAGVTTRDLKIPGEVGDINARFYHPNDLGPRAGLILYFHGGGFVIGDLKTHHFFCWRLALLSGSSVLAVDYRLAPGNPYPAAAHDCISAARWLAENREQLCDNKGPMVVAGDSAGGNLAAVVAREVPGTFDGQCLIYPTTRHYDPITPCYEEKAKGYVLTLALMQWFWDSYTPPAGKPYNHSNAPLAVVDGAPVPDGLAPAIVITAEHDPLRDEGKDYAFALNAAGVTSEYHHYA